MTVSMRISGEDYTVDLSQPIDISLPLADSDKNPIAWYIGKPEITPVRFGDWVGRVSEGASTNFNNILFNPHGHGTHTECLGHITRERYSINQSLKQFFFLAQLISVEPEASGEDFIIRKHQIEKALNGNPAEALVIRTLPNSSEKCSKNYSNTNPPYLDEAAAVFIREVGIKHLLIDLPSVDREQDEGKLLSHKAFWNVQDINVVNDDARFDATITEMIFVPDDVADGKYLLNLQIASFENDATPSKPVLYKLRRV